jgi:hypothetical protein
MADDPPALEQHHCDAGANFVRNRSPQTNVHKQLQAIITVLSLINPAICAAMLARGVAGQSLIQMRLRASRFRRW